jgi:NAD(P)H dehydrogenase (quinone)
MILLTGAAGKTGKAILCALAGHGMMVRALVFRSEQIHEVAALGANEVVVGDIRDTNFIHRAVKGVKSVYHICPNVHPEETIIGQEIIDAATKVKISHFIYHSVLHPQIEVMPHHWKKMRVEERLFESGLPYTILQPAVYMQNILSNLENIIETGKYTVPYAVGSCISMVDLEDVAQAVARVLSEVNSEGNQSIHHGATYELVGAQALSQTEVAAILTQQLGRPVIAESVSIDTWERNARASGLGDYQVSTLVKMFDYYEKYGFGGNSHVLSWLLNRPTTSFDAFIKRTVEDFLHLTL